MKTKKPKMREREDTLVERFADAGLVAEITDTPIRAGWGVRAAQQDQIFQMDIQRKIRNVERSEFFRIWRGDPNNLVQVVSIDKSIRQLVLMVKEPRREFTEDVPNATVQHQKKRHGQNWFAEFLREHHLSKKDLVEARNLDGPFPVIKVRRFTAEGKRHFLCGVDERQLFIAQLPRGVTTVQDAHASLKTALVTLAEGRVDGRTVRQGEWFFVNVTPDEKREINDGIRKNTLAVQKEAAIHREANGRPAGKPHIADEMVRLHGRRLEHGFSVRQDMEIFVRGRVRHPDHATVKFGEWRRVIRNNEPQANAGFGSGGVFWVD